MPVQPRTGNVIAGGHVIEGAGTPPAGVILSGGTIIEGLDVEGVEPGDFLVGYAGVPGAGVLAGLATTVKVIDTTTGTVYTNTGTSASPVWEAPSSGPEPIFSADFEDQDLTAWALGGVAYDATVTISAAAALAGSYGLRVTVPDNGTTGYGLLLDAYPDPNPTDVYRVDCTLRVNAVAMGSDPGENIHLLRLGNFSHDVAILRWRPGPLLDLLVKRRSGATTALPLAFTPALGVAFAVRLVYDASGTDPVVTCAINDTLLATDTDDGAATVNVTPAYVMLIVSPDTEVDGDASVDFDDLALYDAVGA